MISVLIGIFNLYDIIKNVNILIFQFLEINDKNILYFLIIFLFFFLIFYNNLSLNLEFELILGLGVSALFFLLISKEIILFFLALELYSLSVYLLLFKNNPEKAKITVVYFLIGSISSCFILLSFALFYLNTGSLDLTLIFQQFDTFVSYHDNKILFFAVSLFFIGLLFKIGAAPFQFWVIRVYSQMDLNILIYQSIVPKIFYIFFFFSLLSHLDSSSLLTPFLLKLLIFSSFLSLIIGAIGPLTHNVNHFKTILAYSSVLHVGYLLLGLAAFISTTLNSPNLNILQYLLIYGFNTLHILMAFKIIEKVLNRFQYNKSLLYLTILISVFSYIGLPPFAGFYAKLNIFFNVYFAENPIFLISIFLILISTIISAFLYLKFVHFFYFINLKDVVTERETLLHPGIYLYSGLTIILGGYPILLPYFTPIFEYLMM